MLEKDFFIAINTAVAIAATVWLAVRLLMVPSLAPSHYVHRERRLAS